MKAIGNEIRESTLFICHECSRLVQGDADRRHFCASSDFLLGVIAGMSGDSKTDAYMVLGLSSFDLERVNDQDFCDGYVVGSDIADARWSHAEIEAQLRLIKMVARMTALNVEQFAETPVGQALRQVAFSQGRQDGLVEGAENERASLNLAWSQFRRARDKHGFSDNKYQKLMDRARGRILGMPLEDLIALHAEFNSGRTGNDVAEAAQ